jgi:hypothetical protein
MAGALPLKPHLQPFFALVIFQARSPIFDQGYDSPNCVASRIEYTTMLTLLFIVLGGLASL